MDRTDRPVALALMALRATKVPTVLKAPRVTQGLKEPRVLEVRVVRKVLRARKATLVSVALLAQVAYYQPFLGMDWWVTLLIKF